MVKSRARECSSERLDEIEAAGEEATPEGNEVIRDRNARVRTAYRRLPERDQQLLTVLMASPPLSYQEVATTLQMPVGSIGPTRARCLERLRRELAVVGVDKESISA